MRGTNTLFLAVTHKRSRAKVLRELKKTVYKPRVVVLGSRQQMCVHPEVSGLVGTQQRHMCRLYTKSERYALCNHGKIAYLR